MGYNARLHPHHAVSVFGSVATDATASPTLFSAAFPGQILGARLVNGATASVASGTTAGSSLNVYVTKNASDTSASALCASRLAAVATLATINLALATSTSLQRFSAGDTYGAHLVGGAGNDADNSGLIVQLSYMYGWSFPDTASP
jgi:hypothetical protein